MNDELPRKRYECGFCGSIIIVKKSENPKCLCGGNNFILLSEEFGSTKPSKQIFIKMKNIFKKYIDTSELNYNLITIWTLGTYFHSQFETYPLLLFNARKQSGKTRTMKLASVLSSGGDGSTTTSITETFLFRHREGALFFDELESISSKEKTTLRELINSVYKKGNKVIRYTEQVVNGKKDFVPVAFYPYYPLSLANIGGFNDILSDRSIQIILQRSDRDHTRLIEDFTTNPQIISLKKTLSNLEMIIPQKIFTEWNQFIQNEDYNPDLKILFHKVHDTNIYGRALELFFPLFLVADSFGILDEIIFTSKMYLDMIDGDTLDNIDDLLHGFLEGSKYEGFVNQSKVLEDFKHSLENQEDWMNCKWFGRSLKRLGFIEKKRLVDGRVQVILKNNSTNPINTINTLNSINTTKTKNDNKKEVELVDNIELVGFIGGGDNDQKNKHTHPPNDLEKVNPSKIEGVCDENFCSKCGKPDAFIIIKDKLYCKECGMDGGV